MWCSDVTGDYGRRQSARAESVGGLAVASVATTFHFNAICSDAVISHDSLSQ